jgi:predicted Zn-ribbon and HTH transcriptional regulator
MKAVSVRDALESLLVSVSCPICGYEFDVALIDVRLEARTFCPNCKKPIQLVDADHLRIESVMRSTRRCAT